MRVFPIEDKDNSVGEIVEQLCDLISSGEGTPALIYFTWIARTHTNVTSMLMYNLHF